MSGSYARLDLEPELLELSEDLDALQAFASIAETIRDEVLKPCSIHFDSETAKKNGYIPLMLTKAQHRDFYFIVGHLSDLASKAAEKYQEAAEKVLREA